MPDSEGYPTEDELHRIRTWPAAQGWEDFWSLICHAWNWAFWGFGNHRDGSYTLSTGGWSGNESIIAAMQENTIFWALWWESSRRGGHYVFRKYGHDEEV